VSELKSPPFNTASESERNKAAVRRLVEDVMNQGRLEVLDEIFSPSMAAAAKAWIAPFRASFPDVRMRIVDLVAEGAKVVGRFTCSGTQRGEWRGHPPSGRRFEGVAEVYFFELHEGRVVRGWGLEDDLSRLRQLGYLDESMRG
jgi:predicted ester cyclase